MIAVAWHAPSHARAIGSLGEVLRVSDEDDEPDDEPQSPAAAESRAAREEARSMLIGTVKQMVVACWKPLLGALSALMARFASEEAVQSLLKCYQAFTQTCASLRLVEPRDAFLASLCQYALPPRAGGEVRDSAGSISFAPVDAAYEPLPHTRLSAKNVQSLKAVFNIAHCMGGLLGSSWNLILNTLEQLDRIIASSKTTASGGSRAVELADGRPRAWQLSRLHIAS